MIDDGFENHTFIQALREFLDEAGDHLPLVEGIHLDFFSLGAITCVEQVERLNVHICSDVLSFVL